MGQACAKPHWHIGKKACVRLVKASKRQALIYGVTTAFTVLIEPGDSKRTRLIPDLHFFSTFRGM